MRVRYTVPALADLEGIIDDIAAISPQGARNVARRIESATSHLCDFPRMGTPTNDPTIRRTTTSPYPYLIFYEVTDDYILVHAVRHGARDPRTMPGHDP